MITLICGDQKWEVDPLRAQAVLKIQKQMHSRNGWKLPEDSPYEFVDNALIKRGNTKDCKGTSKRKRNTGGEVSPKPAEVSRGDGPEQT